MELAKEKRGHFLYHLFCPKEVFLTYWIHSQNIHTFTYQKTLLHTFLLLLLKIIESLQYISLSLFYRYYFCRCSYELTQLISVPYFQRRSTQYSDWLHNFSVTIPRCYKDFYVKVSFFAQLGSGILCLQNAFLWPMS